MNVTPTSGPMASRNTHHARDATSSRYSLATSHEKEETAVPSLCEGKEHLFEIAGRRAARGCLRRELVERALAANRATAQQDEAVADTSRVLDLVNRQEHGPASGRVGAQRLRHLAALTKVETVERLVSQQKRLRHQQSNRKERALALALGQAADRGIEQGTDVETLHDLVAQMGATVEEPECKIECPAYRLCRPRHDGIGKVEQRGGAILIAQRTIVVDERARVEREHAE